MYGGRLPIHVRCLIDEAANIGQIPGLERLMATIRSREISACLVLQAQSQLKALYAADVFKRSVFFLCLISVNNASTLSNTGLRLAAKY